MKELLLRFWKTLTGQTKACDCKWNLCTDCTDWISKDNW